MKKTLLALLSCSTLLLAAEAVRYTPSHDAQMVKISGTSTLHDWSVEGKTINGSLQMTSDATATTAAATWSQAGNVVTVVEIPVNTIHADHSRMERIMNETLKSDKFPTIKYEMSSSTLAKPGTNDFTVDTTGKLTIAGKTRDVQMKVNAVRNGNKLSLSGSIPIKMTDYGITPPVAMMGTLHTGDAVTVTFRWIVEAH